MEVVEDLLTTTNRPLQLPTNLEESEKDVLGYKIKMEDMAKLWYTKELLGWDDRELLFWHHRLKHCTLKKILRLSKRLITPQNISKARKFSPCTACLFRKFHNRPWMTKCKHPGGFIRNKLESRPGIMTSVDHMIPAQPVITPKVTGAITHERFWKATTMITDITTS